MSVTIPTEIKDEWELLTQGCVEIVPEEEFAQKLLEAKKKSRPLRVKYGADPSAPDIHLGHTVPIRKLKQFEELGHQVVFLIGDFTARIGDPSGRSETRNRLTKEDVETNARTYLDQIFKILDESKTEVVFNSSWLEKLTFSDVIELSAKYTVARMLERDDFKKRFGNNYPIYVHEFLYPLVQAYDSVAVRADVELGGTDQIFNLLVGREIQREFGQPPQAVMTTPLLVGLDGEQKMSKSLRNYIGITEPPDEIYGKTMSIPDSLLGDYYVLTLGRPKSEVDRMLSDIESGALHPRDVKARLAHSLVALYHSDSNADAAQERFDRLFRERELPEEMEEKEIASENGKKWIVKVLVESGLATSNRQVRRSIEQGAVSVDGEKVTDENVELVPGEYVLRVGKRRFMRIRLT